jgi:hypothetical protein
LRQYRDDLAYPCIPQGVFQVIFCNIQVVFDARQERHMYSLYCYSSLQYRGDLVYPFMPQGVFQVLFACTRVLFDARQDRHM